MQHFFVLKISGSNVRDFVRENTVRDMFAGTTDFWQLSSVATESTDTTGTTTVRKLLAYSDMMSPDSIDASLMQGSMHARTLQETTSTTTFRNNIDFALHVVFYNADRASMLNPDVIAQIKAIEDSIYDLPQYERLCLHAVSRKADGRFNCRRPISYTNVVYGRFDDSGRFIADGSADIQQDPVKASQVWVPFCSLPCP